MVDGRWSIVSMASERDADTTTWGIAHRPSPIAHRPSPIAHRLFTRREEHGEGARLAKGLAFYTAFLGEVAGQPLQ